MIVDSSALIAIAALESGHDLLLKALSMEQGLLPTPALVEFRRVASRKRELSEFDADRFVTALLSRNLRLLPFDERHAHAANEANAAYGIGNTRGGSLNLLDLMVYACAKVEGRPILCTGRDFAATGIAIHPASRTGH